MTELFLTLTFLAAALGIVAGYFMCVDLAQRDEFRASKRVEELRKDAKAAEAPPLFGSASEIDLGEFAPPAPPKADRPGLSGLLRRDLARPLRGWVAHAGLTVRPAQLVAATGVLALGLGVAGQLAQGPLLGVPGVIVGAAAPFVWVEARRRARRERFLAQLPGAFDLMARVIRSGQSVPQSFQAVADSFEEPVAGAFARCREQQNLGLAPDVAFQELAEHTGVLEMRIFVVAMLIQRQAGGNLSEVLERLAGLLRERGRVRKQVRTLTAEGRMQAAVLLALPFFLFVAMRFVNRAYADALLERGGLVAATLASMAVGALWIRKIVNFEV